MSEVDAWCVKDSNGQILTRWMSFLGGNILKVRFKQRMNLNEIEFLALKYSIVKVKISEVRYE